MLAAGGITYQEKGGFSMTARKNPGSGRRSGARNDSRGIGNKRLTKIGDSTAQIVKDAATLLDEEVAAGIVAARQMQQRFQKERRIDPGDFNKALQKFQGDAHDLVALLNHQIDGLSSQENAELAKRLVNNTHDVIDLAVELINLGTEITNQLVESNLPRSGRSGAKRSR
jgi:hypothetical protein